MSVASSLQRGASANSIDSCRKLAAQFLAERITLEEYAFNAMIRMVSVLEDDLPSCVDLVPASIAASFTEFLRAELEPVDFMPFPGAFLVGPTSEELIDKIKRQHRPKYILICRLMNDRSERLAGGETRE